MDKGIFSFSYFKENRTVLVLVSTWLLLANMFALLSLNRFSLRPDDAYKWMPVEKYDQGQEDGFVKMHSRWDSNWYLDVAKKGYYRKSDDTLSNVVFFPLYPLVIRLFSQVLGGDLIFSGWMVSVFFLFLSSIYLYRLVRDFHKSSDPVLSVFLMLVFPTAFFLNAVYTESLFMFLSIVSFYCGRKRNYWLAGFLGLLAALSRITGILLFLPLFLQALGDQGFNWKKTVGITFPLLMIPAGTGMFFLYHFLKFGDFLLFFRVESVWGRSFSLNADHFSFAPRASAANLTLDFLILLFVAICIGILIKKRELAYALYAASTILVAVATGTLMSIGRYSLVLFPIFILGASIKNETVKMFWVVCSTMLMAFYTIAFVNWYWAG